MQYSAEANINTVKKTYQQQKHRGQSLVHVEASREHVSSPNELPQRMDILGLLIKVLQSWEVIREIGRGRRRSEYTTA